MWLILDRAQEEQDRKLAEHVLTVHSAGAAPAPVNELEPLTPQQLRTYIALAKQHAPRIPEDLTDYVAAIYAEMRRQEAMSDRPQSYTTPRTLLSILRLSQALAKLRFDNKVRHLSSGFYVCRVQGRSTQLCFTPSLFLVQLGAESLKYGSRF